MTSTNHMHRASAPGSGRLDLSLAGRRASRRTRSQRVAVVVAHVPPALLRSSSMEVLERPSAQDPAKSGHECLTRGTATMSRSRAHTHTRRWHALRACGGDNQTNQGTRRTRLRGCYCQYCVTYFGVFRWNLAPSARCNMPGRGGRGTGCYYEECVLCFNISHGVMGNVSAGIFSPHTLIFPS